MNPEDRKVGLVTRGAEAGKALGLIEPILREMEERVVAESSGGVIDPANAVQAWARVGAIRQLRRELEKRISQGERASRQAREALDRQAPEPDPRT